MSRFKKLVTDKIEELGVKKSSQYFGVSLGTISNWSSGKSSPSLEAVEIALGEADFKEFEKKQPEQPLEQWEGKNLIMLLPLYRGFSSDTHFTLFANYAKYGAEKIGMIMEKRTVIHESRNILAHKFLKTGAQYAIMVDDDMVLPAGSVDLFNGRYGAGVSMESAGFNAISRLMSHPADAKIVGALYFGRHTKGRAQCSSGFTSDMENDNYRAGKHKGLKPEEWVGTGFLRIHRSVFEQMKTEIDAGKWPECKPSREDLWYGFFNPVKVGVGEDVSFGRRAREIGIQSYVDASLVALHCGETNFGPSNTRN